MKTAMRFLKGTLILYSVILTAVLVSGAATFGASSGNYIVPILSLPIAVYFLFFVLNVKKGRKLLFYYSLTIASLMTISGFKQASTISELSSTLIFLPMTIYFWSQAIPKRKKRSHAPFKVVETEDNFGFKIHEEEKAQELKKVEDLYPADKFGKNFDLDRRMFLKLIGSAGISVFMLALFTKKSHAAFFGSVPGPGTVALKDSTGAQIDPAIKQPTDGYKINQLDDTSSSTYSYFGYTNKDGDWFIMRETISGVNVGDYRYYKKKVGDGNFATEWPNRATLSPYDYFDVIF